MNTTTPQPQQSNISATKPQRRYLHEKKDEVEYMQKIQHTETMTKSTNTKPMKSIPKHNPRALLNAPIINRHALQVDTPLFTGRALLEKALDTCTYISTTYQSPLRIPIPHTSVDGKLYPHGIDRSRKVKTE